MFCSWSSLANWDSRSSLTERVKMHHISESIGYFPFTSKKNYRITSPLHSSLLPPPLISTPTAWLAPLLTSVTEAECVLIDGARRADEAGAPLLRLLALRTPGALPHLFGVDAGAAATLAQQSSSPSFSSSGGGGPARLAAHPLHAAVLSLRMGVGASRARVAAARTLWVSEGRTAWVLQRFVLQLCDCIYAVGLG